MFFNTTKIWVSFKSSIFCYSEKALLDFSPVYPVGNTGSPPLIRGLCVCVYLFVCVYVCQKNVVCTYLGQSKVVEADVTVLL